MKILWFLTWWRKQFVVVFRYRWVFCMISINREPINAFSLRVPGPAIWNVMVILFMTMMASLLITFLSLKILQKWWKVKRYSVKVAGKRSLLWRQPTSCFGNLMQWPNYFIVIMNRWMDTISLSQLVWHYIWRLCIRMTVVRLLK